MNVDTYAELDGTPHAAHKARELVRHMLGEDHPSASDATLIASELTANAVAHTRSGRPGGTLILAIEITEQPPSVCIRIRDAGAPSTPQLAEPGPDGEHGRGLRIIDALATDWGTEPSGHGRATWCRLTQATIASGPDTDPRSATSPNGRAHQRRDIEPRPDPQADREAEPG